MASKEGEWKVMAINKITVTKNGMNAEGSIDGKRANLKGTGDFSHVQYAHTSAVRSLKVRWPIRGPLLPNDVKPA